MKYKIAVCDDFAADRNYITDLTRAWAVKAGHTIQLSHFASAESFLFHYTEENDFDILLLDIEMETMDGVSMAKRLRLDNQTIQIIFITGYPDFISEGYEVSALHYLIKPIRAEKLFQVLDRACEKLNKTERVILLRQDRERIRLSIDKILFVEAFSHNLMFHTIKGSIETRITMSEALQQLGKDFIRCHRSYLINLKHISRITKTEVFLDDNTTLPLSRNLYRDVNLAFIDYYKENLI